ncbi:MAG: hypothetical protein KDA32_01765 [Phycisphaerales bacterium]|nr:hypothetical protein [Phycisphaerales bacterium]
MNRSIVRIACALTLCGAMTAAFAMQDAKPEKSAAQRAFDRLKETAGEWISREDADKPNPDVWVSRRVTSNGSVILEDMFPGSNHEMITMYYVEGDHLVLVHYCALGNQPMMTCKPGDGDEYKFEFAGGGNIKPDKDMHMHDATMRLTGKDSMWAEWRSWNDGKQMDSVVFDLIRKPKSADK